MAGAGIDLNSREFRSRIAMVAIEPEDRFASRSPSSLPSYVSSEATELGAEIVRDPADWNEVQKNQEISRAIFKQYDKNWATVADLGRQIMQRNEEEEFKRLGYHPPKRPYICISGSEDLPSKEQPLRFTRPPAPPVGEATVGPRRSARIAQLAKRREHDALRSETVPQQSKKGPARRRGRPPKNPHTSTVKGKPSKISKPRSRHLKNPHTGTVKETLSKISKPRGRPRKQPVENLTRK